MPVLAFDLEGAVRSLVEKATLSLERPPVNARRVARDCFGLPLIWDETISRARLSERRRGVVVVMVKSHDRNERVNFAIAHELGEWLCRDRHDVEEEHREAFCNHFASLLLTPPEWFDDDCRHLDFDLLELKEIYSTASHEVIARRMPAVEPCGITIVDNGKRYLRDGSSDFAFPRKIQDCEWSAIRDCNRLRQPIDRRVGQVRLQCWPIHENGFEREILRTSIDEFADSWGYETDDFASEREFTEWGC